MVAYDEALDGGATRLWWLLRHHGHDDVAVLDGGLASWRAAVARCARGRGDEPGDFEARPRGDDVADADEIAAGSGTALTLLDARAPARYGGEEPIDPVAGHIPGAINTPFAELVPDGRSWRRRSWRERLGAGERELVAYCGSGVTACTVVLAASAGGPQRPALPGLLERVVRARPAGGTRRSVLTGRHHGPVRLRRLFRRRRPAAATQLKPPWRPW